MLDRAEAGAAVSIGWLMEELGGRSFGLALLVMGVLGLVPGISTVAALMVVWIAVQMMLGQEAAVLPGLVARRSIGVERLARVIGFVAPRLAWVERLVQPRWPLLFQTTIRAATVEMPGTMPSTPMTSRARPNERPPSCSISQPIDTAASASARSSMRASWTDVGTWSCDAVWS